MAETDTDLLLPSSRKKNPYLEKLLAEGMSTAPIQSHWQGAARLANALLGGIEMGMEDRRDIEGRKELAMILGGGPATGTAAPAAPAASSAAPAAAPDASSGDITGRIRKAETGGSPYATNPRSSAAGPDQFIDSTWLDTVAKNRPDVMQGRSRADVLALRNDENLSREMTAAYAKSNQGALQGAGLPNTPGTTYLAHFAGPQGAINIMRADPRAPVGTVLGEQVVSANPFLAKMTAGDLVAWADQKMGGRQPGAPPSQAPTAQGPDGPQPGSQRSTFGMPPETAAKVRALVMSRNPMAQKMGIALWSQYAKPGDQWQQYKAADGTLLQRNLTTGEVKAAGTENAAISEAQFAQQNWKQLGFPDPKSADVKDQQFWREYNAKRLGGAGVNVAIDQRAADEFEKGYGEGISKRALATVDAGDKAVVQMQKVQLAQRMLQDVQTGKLTPATATVGGWLQAAGINPAQFGIDPKQPMTAEALSALTSELVIGKIGAGGFPANNFSNPDREFLVQGVFKLADRPEANFIKLEVARRLAQFDSDKADAWSEARANKVSYEAFDRDWRKQTQSKNVFGDLIEQAKAFGELPGQKGGPIDQKKLREGVGGIKLPNWLQDVGTDWTTRNGIEIRRVPGGSP